MNTKQAYILVLAIIAFVFCTIINIRGLNFTSSQNEATSDIIINARPLLAEWVVTAIVFGTIFVLVRTPKKKD